MTVSDCSSLELRSWHGAQPPLKEVDIPTQWVAYKYPDGFAHQFNMNSVAAMQRKEVCDRLPSVENACYVSPFLFFCPGIHPRAVTQYFLQKPTELRSLFFYYFSAANLDFMALDDACRLLFSRIAFPEDMNNLLNIFMAFADAYLSANDYFTFSVMEVVRLAVGAVLVSMSKRKSESLSYDEFLKVAGNVKASPDYTRAFYDSMMEKPIVLFFTMMTFTVDPDIQKTGSLMVAGGVVKRKKKLFSRVTEEGVLFYKDEKLKEESMVIPLINAAAKVATQGKDQFLVIYSNDGMPFGYKMKKSKKKELKTAQHEFLAVNDSELRSWLSNINFMAFLLTMRKLATENA